MKSNNKPIPLVEEIVGKSISNNNKDIIIGLPKNKKEEDDNSVNSANYSGAELKESHNSNNVNAPNPFSFSNMSKKSIERYQEKLKEKTMRMEIDKRYTETERLRIKRVAIQLILILIEGIIYLLFNLTIYYIASHSKESSAIFGICLSITQIAFCFILFISLNFGLLNDPNLSKTFRLFIVIESFVIFCTFIFNIILTFISKRYIHKMKQFKNKFIFYFIFLIMIFLSIAIFKFCWNLFFESVLILLGKKTEYSILIFNEQNLKSNEINFDTNLSASNNITNENLVNSVSLFNNEDKHEDNDKEEEQQYKAFNYFNNFHYSVSSTRQADYPGFKKN